MKTRHYLELLTPEKMKLLRSSKCKLSRDEYGENVPNLAITKAVLVHSNIFNDDYQHDSRVLYTFFPNK